MGRYVLKLDELGLEIAQIAFPAALAFTADPIASLVDTAFVGQIGIPSDHANVYFFFLIRSQIEVILSGVCYIDTMNKFHSLSVAY
jgi:Na+-driven multidrug efflux pump